MRWLVKDVRRLGRCCGWKTEKITQRPRSPHRRQHGSEARSTNRVPHGATQVVEIDGARFFLRRAHGELAMAWQTFWQAS
jgi:hypothetical protein